ncbi:MAG: hypothetical protein KCHDKBKB_02935 [Elusimicrobia bacterium]|nr:hypothetical protein [Elusimicrobiota bacterium]
MNNETKVGLFLLAALGAILTSILTLGNVQFFSRNHRYYIDFENVEALPPKAAVKVAGVEIGKVRRVQLIQGRARVTINIQPDVKVYADAVAQVDSTGIIGTKYVELKPGSPSQPELPRDSIIRGNNTGSVNQMIAKLSALFDTDEKNGNVVDNLKETMANIRNVTRALNTAMGTHGRDMEEIVMNVRDLTASLKVFSAHLEEISTERKDDFKVAIEKFRGVGEKLDALLAKLGRGEGTIGALLNDKETETNMKEAVASIKDTAASAKKVMGRFTNIHTYWDYRFRYDHDEGEGRSDLAIKFVPKPGKFYALGATNLGQPVSNEKNVEKERKNRFVAVMGQDLGPFTGYAGVIRARGGFGLNFRPFYFLPKWNRRFELNAEVSDFSRDRVVQGEHLESSLLNVGAHVSITRWLWIGARAEDLFEKASYQTYVNIIFRDTDLSYLLGLASVAGR